MNLLISALYDEASPIDEIFDKRIVATIPDELPINTTALVIWGGDDISPTIYGHDPAFKYTDARINLTQRDFLEVQLAQDAIKKGIPIIGICRGAQLMCALSGGTLIQHVTGHGLWKGHKIVTKDGLTVYSNSVHHQMMNPFKVDHEMIAWCPERLSMKYIGSANKEIDKNEIPVEPEIVWFPQTHALCIQGHPEFSSATTSFIKLCQKLIKEYIVEKVSVDPITTH